MFILLMYVVCIRVYSTCIQMNILHFVVSHSYIINNNNNYYNKYK